MLHECRAAVLGAHASARELLPAKDALGAVQAAGVLLLGVRARTPRQSPLHLPSRAHNAQEIWRQSAADRERLQDRKAGGRARVPALPARAPDQVVQPERQPAEGHQSAPHRRAGLVPRCAIASTHPNAQSAPSPPAATAAPPLLCAPMCIHTHHPPPVRAAGKLQSQVCCRGCGHESNTVDPFLDLSLELHANGEPLCRSVADAMRRFTEVRSAPRPTQRQT